MLWKHRGIKNIVQSKDNSMELNDRYRHDKIETRRSTICRICKKETEDLTHFILKCEGIERRDIGMIKELEGRCEKETLGKMLFKGEKVKEV